MDPAAIMCLNLKEGFVGSGVSLEYFCDLFPSVEVEDKV